MPIGGSEISTAFTIGPLRFFCVPSGARATSRPRLALKAAHSHVWSTRSSMSRNARNPSWMHVAGSITLAMPTVALLVRINVCGGSRTLRSRPASVTPCLISCTTRPGAAVTSEIFNHGIGPPKYLGSPAGRGLAPRMMRASSPSFTIGQEPFGLIRSPKVRAKRAPASWPATEAERARNSTKASARSRIAAIRRCSSMSGNSSSRSSQRLMFKFEILVV